jgi:hypothetical protein
MTAWRSRVLLAAAVMLLIAAAALLAATRPADRPRPRSAATPRTCPPAPAAEAPPGRVVWQADMEEGALDDWRRPADGEAGGGVFHSGSGWAIASRGHARTGAWSAKLTLADGEGGARLFRWSELRDHRNAAIRVWLYIPKSYRPSADARNGRFWNVLQFKSRSARGANDPLWFVNFATDRSGRLRLQLIWWHRTLEGPWRGDSGFLRIGQRRASVPVGRWFRLAAELRQSNGFDGRLCVWQGTRRLFALGGIRTSYRNCAHNAWCALNEWSVNNYSDGLRPAPTRVYADDARVDAW